MPDIEPFRGYRYNPALVPLPEVIAPPYDVISPHQQALLYDANPHNIVRLILGREDDRYSSAARCYEEWKHKRLLLRDEQPAFYLLHQTFADDDGHQVTRRGFIVRCKLEGFDKQIVLPHEKTLAKPREDRLKLFKATEANFSQVFSLYSDPAMEIDATMKGIDNAEPIIDVEFEEVRNKLWRVEDGGAIQSIQRFLRRKQVLIADGHHRYETALAFRDFKKSQNSDHTGSEPYNYVMMFLTNIDEKGLVIFPTHRVVHSLLGFNSEAMLKKLERTFIVRKFREFETLSEGLKSSSTMSFGVVMSGDPAYSLISLKPSTSLADIIAEPIPPEVKELDVTVLHTLILRDILGISLQDQEQKANLDYVKDVRQALRQVEERDAQLAFFLKPTRIDQVRAVAKAGHTMPQKSTYFYPKLLSGLVINPLGE
jgi:uncharacterized protein (DUF1015 family)